jgi:hypothetical protein
MAGAAQRIEAGGGDAGGLEKDSGLMNFEF